MYEQTYEIEHRLSDLLRLVGESRFSTPQLADLLNVSIPTVSRGIKALRSRGYVIESVRNHDGAWCYRLVGIESDEVISSEHVSTTVPMPRKRVGT